MANIVLRLSGGTGNTSPAASIGGAMGTGTGAVITTSNTTLNNLFDNISKAENFAGTVDYRCVYIHNDTSTPGALFANGALYKSGSSLATFQFGMEAAKNTAASTIANETTAPTGITFVTATSSSPLALMTSSNTLNPGDYIGVWIKRTADHITGSGTVTDTLSLVVSGTE